MTDILLIQPPVRDFYTTAKRSIPYGLACIAASLLKHGFSVEILDSLATPKSRNIPQPAEMGYLSKYYGARTIPRSPCFIDINILATVTSISENRQKNRVRF